jgi:hypothetical protein
VRLIERVQRDAWRALSRAIDAWLERETAARKPCAPDAPD